MMDDRKWDHEPVDHEKVGPALSEEYPMPESRVEAADYLLDPGNFDSAKDARNHKNRALGRAVWFWLTMAFFVWLTFATPAISTVAILAKCLCMVMAIFYAIIALAQTANYWEDDMDGLIRPEDRWRF